MKERGRSLRQEDRQNAVRSRPPRTARDEVRRNGFTWKSALILALLLAAPAAAVYRLSASIDYRILPGYWAVISLFTYIIYVLDKQRARQEAWRIPEQTLHIAEFLGGWAAAFVAQRVIRHKISKREYQWGFWFIVAVHQYAALDYLLDRGITRSIIRQVQGWFQ